VDAQLFVDAFAPKNHLDIARRHAERDGRLGERGIRRAEPPHNALGHCHPRWVAAVQAQAATLIHVSNLFRHPNQGQLAQRLVGYAGPGRVFFCNSGAESNEALIKLARLHGIAKSGEEGKCPKIICAKSAFHGRTSGGMSGTP
jgi:acetylornithine aminotransferase/acetylornithine/N-succinyldiaminopimelate aminotransferase